MSEAADDRWKIDGDKVDRSGAPLFIFAHGAGAPMDSDFMHAMTALLVARGVGVVRFEFGYMAGRRLSEKRQPPPKMPVLEAEYRSVIAGVVQRYPQAKLLIGGKSMGGRVASLVADAEWAAGRIAGCICVGYPFHPAKQSDKLRTAHLADMRCPTLIVQGERDSLGDRNDVDGYRLSQAIEIGWIGDGDHDLRPRKSSSLTPDGNLSQAADAIAAFAGGTILNVMT